MDGGRLLEVGGWSLYVGGGFLEVIGWGMEVKG